MKFFHKFFLKHNSILYYKMKITSDFSNKKLFMNCNLYSHIICNYQILYIHLEIREGFVRENQTTAKEYTGGQIPGIRKRRNQRNRSHLPIV